MLQCFVGVYDHGLLLLCCPPSCLQYLSLLQYMTLVHQKCWSMKTLVHKQPHIRSCRLLQLC